MDLAEVLAALDALPAKDREQVVADALRATEGRLFVPNTGPQTDCWFSEADETFYGGAAGGGKGLCLDTPLPCPSGFVRMGDVKVGDILYDKDGEFCTVTAVSPVNNRPCFEVCFDDGSVIVSDDVHRWLTLTDAERSQIKRLSPSFREARRATRPSRAVKESKKPWVSQTVTEINRTREYDYKLPPVPRIRDTTEILNTLRVGKDGRANHSVDVAGKIDGASLSLPVDPYLLGLWLGDGYSALGKIGMLADDWDEILPHVKNDIVSRKIETGPSGKREFVGITFKGLRTALRSIGLIGLKRIPVQYLRASREQRVELLRGLMDTDGSCDKSGRCEIGLSNRALAEDVHELVSSLGIKSRLSQNELSKKNPNWADSFRLNFRCDFRVFKLTRKHSRQKTDGLRDNVTRRYIVDVRPIDSVPTKCIAVDSPSRTYLAGRTFVPTHNTAILCGLAADEYHPALILRREATQIKGIEDELERILGTREGYNSQTHIWRLSNGGTIELGGVPNEKDKEKYQGRPHRLKGFDEITQFAESQYRYIIGWLRDAKGRRCRVLATGNPPTTAQGMWVVNYWAPWLKKDHPNPAKSGELRWFTTVDGEDMEVDRDYVGPNGERPRSRTFIASKLEDNPDLMATGYAATLEAMPKELRERLRHGAFDVEPEDDEWQVIPTRWLMAAQARWTSTPPDVPMTSIACDVAQGGKDKTQIQWRYGDWYSPFDSHKGEDTPDGPTVAALIVKQMRDRCRVVVDAGGGYGGDTLTQLAHADIDCYAFKGSFGSNSTSREGLHRFSNLRSQVVWQFREALDPDFNSQIALPPDSELIADLASYRYDYRGSGRQGGEISVLPKEEQKERLGRSPDKGDTTLMLFGSFLGGLRKPKAAQERKDQRRAKMTATVANSDIKSRLRGHRK
jgi:hypothetical protein